MPKFGDLVKIFMDPSRMCEICGKADTSGPLNKIEGRMMCRSCAQEHIDQLAKRIIMTTTPSVDGYTVSRYLGIEAVEVVIGTGPFSEFSTQIQDFFGDRSTAFEEKLRDAKALAQKKLAWKAHLRGGNAVIGVDLDYTEFTGNRIGVVANGTVVELKPAALVAARKE